MNIEINEGLGDVKGVGKVEELIDVLIVRWSFIMIHLVVEHFFM
jgi:hypothetical protein